jgi:hypothetical protein
MTTRNTIKRILTIRQSGSGAVRIRHRQAGLCHLRSPLPLYDCPTSSKLAQSNIFTAPFAVEYIQKLV